MNIDIKKLKYLIESAYDEGYWSGEKVKDKYLSEVMSQFEEEKTIVEDFRIWTAAELNEEAVGTVFLHSQLGMCRIHSENNQKFMKFDNPKVGSSLFVRNSYPWDIPMRKIREIS